MLLDCLERRFNEQERTQVSNAKGSQGPLEHALTIQPNSSWSIPDTTGHGQSVNQESAIGEVGKGLPEAMAQEDAHWAVDAKEAGVDCQDGADDEGGPG